MWPQHCGHNILLSIHQFTKTSLWVKWLQVAILFSKKLFEYYYPQIVSPKTEVCESCVSWNFLWVTTVWVVEYEKMFKAQFFRQSKHLFWGSFIKKMPTTCSMCLYFTCSNHLWKWIFFWKSHSFMSIKLQSVLSIRDPFEGITDRLNASTSNNTTIMDSLHLSVLYYLF